MVEKAGVKGAPPPGSTGGNGGRGTTRAGGTPCAGNGSGNGKNGHSHGGAPPEVLDAVARLHSGLYVLTSAFENTRLGVMVNWAQQCATEPVSVCVSLLKGHPVSPLIRDSHAFALCAVTDSDRLLLKKFERVKETGPPGASGSGTPGVYTPLVREDPFMSLDVETIATGSPVLKRSRFALDCRVSMHLDFDSDHELYIAQVVAARVYDAEQRPGK